MHERPRYTWGLNIMSFLLFVGVILTHFDFMGVILCLQNLVTHMTNTDSVLLRFDRFFYVLTTVKLVCWMIHLTSIRNFPFSYLVSTESIVRYHLFIALILQSRRSTIVRRICRNAQRKILQPSAASFVRTQCQRIRLPIHLPTYAC